jgi:hypothetical protein
MVVDVPWLVLKVAAVNRRTLHRALPQELRQRQCRRVALEKIVNNA